MFRKSRLCKIISIAILVVFTHQQVGWVQEGRPVWMAETAPHYISSKTDPARIDIPYGTGEVREIFSEDGKQRIIHIQDAHASYSAQLSIANILDHLVANYSIDIIALEGAEGYVDTSLLKTFPDKKTRENTAKFLMKEGKLSAGEFFAITRDDAKPALYGVEDDALYKKNVESFKAVMDERALYVGQLEKLLRQFESLSEKVYSRELRSLEYYSELQRKGEISFSSYWEKIERLAEENRIFPDDYANIKKLLWAIKLEKGIDFPKANEERKKLIDVLSEAISEEDLQEMVLRSVSFKEEKISQVDFHEYLTRLAESYRIDLAGYKNLVMFTGYVSIYHQIDIVALYREVNGLEESLRERLYRNSDERQLSEWIKLANLLAGLYSIELENEGFEYIEKNKKELDPAKCSSFIKDACRRYDVPISGGYDLGDVFRNVDKAMEFYRVAEDRNRAMLSNTVKRMKREGKNIAALITGGYHTKGLTDLMREDKLSYMVIVPKFEAGEERPYVAILTNKKRAYQKLLETGKFQIAVRAYFEDLDEEKLMETVIFALSSVVYDGKDWQEEARMWHSLYATEYERLRKEGHEKVQRSIKPEVFARTLGIGKFEGKGQIKIMPCKEGIFVVRTKDGNETLFLLEPGKGGVLTSPRALSPSQASNIKEELEGGPSGERKRRAPVSVVDADPDAVAEEIIGDKGLPGRVADRIIGGPLDLEHFYDQIVDKLRAEGISVPKEWRSNERLDRCIEVFTNEVVKKIEEKMPVEKKKECAAQALARAGAFLDEKVGIIEDALKTLRPGDVLTGDKTKALETISEVATETAKRVRGDFGIFGVSASVRDTLMWGSPMQAFDIPNKVTGVVSMAQLILYIEQSIKKEDLDKIAKGVKVARKIVRVIQAADLENISFVHSEKDKKTFVSFRDWDWEAYPPETYDEWLTYLFIKGRQDLVDKIVEPGARRDEIEEIFKEYAKDTAGFIRAKCSGKMVPETGEEEMFRIIEEEFLLETDPAKLKRLGEFARDKLRGAPPTATIDSEREAIAPDMSREEYALKVAPLYEEIKYFALPLLLSTLAFGMDSMVTVAIMMTVRGYFFYKHKGARIHAPPQTYGAPLITSTAGMALSVVPFYVSSASFIMPSPFFELILQNPLYYITASTALAVFTHFITNAMYIRYGIRAAFIDDELEDEAEEDPEFNKAVETLQSQESGLDDKVRAARYLGGSGNRKAVSRLAKALNIGRIDRELKIAIIDSLSQLKRIPLPKIKKEEVHSSIMGIINETLEAALGEYNVDPDIVRILGPFDEIRIKFRMEGLSRKEKRKVIKAKKSLAVNLQKKLKENETIAVIHGGRDKGDTLIVDFTKHLDSRNLTPLWRGLGTLDFQFDANENYRKFTPVELVERIQLRAQMLLDGIEERINSAESEDRRRNLMDRYQKLYFFVYGDGTEKNPGLINVMKHPEQAREISDEEYKEMYSRNERYERVVRTSDDGKRFVSYGDSLLIKTESVKSRRDSPFYCTYNDILTMTRSNPYFTHYLENYSRERFGHAGGVKKVIYLARAAGSVFQTSLITDMMRGIKSNDYMFFISEDTVGGFKHSFGAHIDRITQNEGDSDEGFDYAGLEKWAVGYLDHLYENGSGRLRELLDAIWEQLETSGILEGVQGGEHILVVDEIANGTYDFMLKCIVEKKTLNREALKREEKIRALMRKGVSRDKAENTLKPAEPVHVDVFLGRHRTAKIPGYPELEIERIMRDFGISLDRAEEVIAAVSTVADFMPHPVKVNDEIEPPVLDKHVPLELEEEDVQIASYMKALLAVNGIIDYHNNAAIYPVINLLQNDPDPEVRKAAARALPEFDYVRHEKKSDKRTLAGHEAMAVEALTKISETESNKGVKDEAVYAIKKIIARNLGKCVRFDVNDDQRTIEVLGISDFMGLMKKISVIIEGVNSPYPEINDFAIGILSKLDPKAEAKVASINKYTSSKQQAAELLHSVSVFERLKDFDFETGVDYILNKIIVDHQDKMINGDQRPTIAGFIGAQAVGKKHAVNWVGDSLERHFEGKDFNVYRFSMENSWNLGEARREGTTSFGAYTLKGALGFRNFLMRVREGKYAFKPVYDRANRVRFRVIDAVPYIDKETGRVDEEELTETIRLTVERLKEHGAREVMFRGARLLRVFDEEGRWLIDARTAEGKRLRSFLSARFEAVEQCDTWGRELNRKNFFIDITERKNGTFVTGDIVEKIIPKPTDVFLVSSRLAGCEEVLLDDEREEIFDYVAGIWTPPDIRRMKLIRIIREGEMYRHRSRKQILSEFREKLVTEEMRLISPSLLNADWILLNINEFERFLFTGDVMKKLTSAELLEEIYMLLIAHFAGNEGIEKFKRKKEKLREIILSLDEVADGQLVQEEQVLERVAREVLELEGKEYERACREVQEFTLLRHKHKEEDIEEVRIVVGIPFGVYNSIEPGVLESISVPGTVLEVKVLETMDPSNMQRELEETMKETGAHASLIADLYADPKTIAHGIQQGIQALQAGVFACADPGVISTEEAERILEDPDHLARSAIKNLEAIRSFKLEERTLADLRIDNVHRRLFSGVRVSPKARELIDRNLKNGHPSHISVSARNIADLRFLADRLKSLGLDKESASKFLQVRVTAENVDEGNIERCLEVTGLGNYLERKNVVITDPRETTLREALSRIKATFGDDIDLNEVAIGDDRDLVYSEQDKSIMARKDAPIFVQMQGGGVASQLLMAVIEVIANKKGIPKNLGKIVSWESMGYKKWYIFMPNVETFDPEVLREEIELYENQVLIKA